MPPVVSVLTPSYGYARFIEDCLTSVAEQDGVEVQHVVQDAGSDDGTVEILERATDVDWVSEPDEGQSDALNRALVRAKGEWVAWLNADEFYLPGALAALVTEAVRTNSDVVYGESVYVDEQGRLRRLAPQHRFSEKVLREFGCYISSSSILFRRSALEGHVWDVHARRRMDWDLYVSMAAEGRSFSHLRRPIGAFREHEARVTAAPPSDFAEEDARLSVKHGLPGDPEERWRANRVGRWGHPALKLLDGAYRRQVRASRLVGTDLRWFASEAGMAGVRRLLQSCYGED